MGNLAISIKNLSILNSEIYFQKPSIVNKNIFKEQGEKLETTKIATWVKWLQKFYFILTTQYYSVITKIL